MDSDALPPPLFQATLLQGPFRGRNEFSDLIRRTFAAAAVQGWREIIICDPNFEDWPLGERAVTQALGEWSKNGRKFTMLAKNYDEVLRKHPRFVTWRKTWSHIVECRVSASTPADVLPSALWAPGWVMERLDLTHCVGMAGPEVSRRVNLKERLNEWLLKSSLSFPATTLGL